LPWDRAGGKEESPAERKEAGVGRKKPVIERNPRDRDVDEVRVVRDRKPIDPDAALVERLRRREEAAVTALVVAHGDRVHRLAIRLTGNSSDAEEVMQDALWSATRKIDRFRGTGAFRSWLYRVTLNAACRKLRGRRGGGNAVTFEGLLAFAQFREERLPC
jgi:Sigma-70 region 2